MCWTGERMQNQVKKASRIFVTALIFSLCGVGIVYGERIAVFPMEDLSFGVNGYDREISSLVVDEIAALGFEIVSDQEVMDFLVRNRLRWLGYLESYHVLLAKDELKADFLLLGTVNQRREDGKSASVGLSLQLMRTSDSRVVWSDSSGISSADRQKLLGVGEPKTVRELMPDLVKTIFATWPERFDFAEMDVSTIDIASVVLEPKYVKPGDRVLCSVRLRDNGADGEKPQIFIQSGAQVHLAMEVPYLRNYELDKAMVVYRRDKETRQVFREAKSTDTLFRVANEADRPFNEAKESDLPFNEAKERDQPFNEAKERDQPFNEAKESDLPFNEAKENNLPFNEAKESDLPFNEAKESDLPFNEAKESDLPFNEAKESDLPFNEAKESDLPFNEAKESDLPFNEAKQSDLPFNEAKQSDLPFNEAKQSDLPFNEAKQSDLPFNEADASGALRYEAVWIGSDEQVAGYGVLDQTVQVAAATEDARLLRSLWSGMDRDNRYPVTLLVNYPDGEQRTAFLGYYHVDSKPPQVSMRFKGKVIDGMITFRDSVTFLPRLQVPEPISRWRVTITNLDEDKRVVDQEGDGILPPVLNWRGRKSDGLQAIDGKYLISLYVWDRAGNMGEASQQVSYNAQPPEPIFTVARIDEETLGLQVSQVSAVPIEFWRLEARFEDGSLIKFFDGEDFPSQVELPLTEDDLAGRKVGFSIVMKNILGGKTNKKIDDLVAFMKKEDKDGSDPAVSPEDEEWVTDF